MGALSLMRRLAPGLVVVGVLGLAGCGEESTSPTAESTPPAPTATPTESAAAEDLPACDDVWQTGERLPRGYAGCEQDGETVPVDALRCSSGQKFVTFLDTHYAVVGGSVREVDGDIDSDKKYRAAVESCRA